MALCSKCGNKIKLFARSKYYVYDDNGVKHQVCGSCFNTAISSGKGLKWDTSVGKVVMVGDDDIITITKGEFEAAKNTNSNSTNQTFSPVEELKKFKELLDAGIISQEEFEAKKKQMLGL